MGAGGRRFESYHPDAYILSTMNFYSVEYWQENWESLIDRVENGEHIGIENENGNRAIIVSADDELIRMYIDQNNEAP